MNLALNDGVLKTLKSFSAINSGMVFKPGKRFEVAHPLKEVIAFAIVDVEVPSKFAIFDVPKFLGVVSLHDKDSLNLDVNSEEKLVVMQSKRAKTKYRLTDPTNVTSVPDTFNLKVTDRNAEFVLSSDEIEEIKTVSNSLSLPHVVFTNPANKLMIDVRDTKNDSSDIHQIGSATDAVGEFNKVIFKAENLRFLMPGHDYKVVTNTKFAHFVSTDGKLEYFVSLELK